MATLKLFSQPDFLDGSHRVGAPGGYEVWHFHAEDLSQGIRIAASFHDGLASHPDYVRRYRAYRRRPTRNAPPTPSEYPGLKVDVLADEKRLGGATMYLPPGALRVENESVAFDSNRAVFRGGEIDLNIAVREQALTVELKFQPVLPVTRPVEISLGSAAHIWIAARPLCNVSGQIRRGERTIAFEGLGQHNHYYGLEPMLAQAKTWLRGCVLFPRAAESFGAVDEKAIVLSADENGMQTADDAIADIDWKKPLLGGRPYPLSMKLGEKLMLRNPRIATAYTGQMQIIYDAYVDGEQATARVEMDSR